MTPQQQYLISQTLGSQVGVILTIVTDEQRGHNEDLDEYIRCFLDTQVSLAPTHVSWSVGLTFGFPISGGLSVATVTKLPPI